jgi:hypothetical protein
MPARFGHLHLDLGRVWRLSKDQCGLSQETGEKRCGAEKDGSIFHW